MPSIGDLTLADDVANVVFKPRIADPEGSLWVSTGYNANNTASSGDLKASLGVSPASTKRPTNRVKADLAMPNPDYTPGDDKPASVARMGMFVIIPDDFSEVHRNNFKRLVDSFTGSTPFWIAVGDLQGQY